MTAENQNFEMNQGEYKKLIVEQTNDDDSSGKLDISGFNDLIWILKAGRGDKTVVEKKESESTDVTVTDPSVGAYEVIVRPTDTESVHIVGNEMRIYHKVRLLDNSGRPSDLVEGTVTLKAT